MKSKQSKLLSFISPSSSSSRSSSKRPLYCQKIRTTDTLTSIKSCAEEDHSIRNPYKKHKHKQVSNPLMVIECTSRIGDPKVSEHELFQEAREIHANIITFLSSSSSFTEDTKRTSNLFKLTPDGQSWLIHIPRYKPSPKPQRNIFTPLSSCAASTSSQTLSFESQWNTHPKTKKSLGKLYGNECFENRWSQSYGVSYSYSGYKESQAKANMGKLVNADSSQQSEANAGCNMHRSIQEDTILDNFISDIHTYFLASPSLYQTQIHNPIHTNPPSVLPTTFIQKRTYNGCLKNWYLPEHSLAAHSDDERQIRPHSPIFSLSWGGPRRFRIVPKYKNNIHVPTTSINKQQGYSYTKSLDIMIQDGDLVVMGGSMQKTHLHEIPKWRKTKDPPTSRRINWTVREFV